MVKVKNYAIELHIGFPYLIFGFLNDQKHEIVFAEDEIDVPPSLLNFSYKLFVEKYIPNIILHNISNFEESGLAIGGNVLDVPLMYEPIIKHPLN